MRILRPGVVVAALFALLSLARPALADPALWVVKDADSTIYLFGTIHYLRPETAWRYPALETALAESRELVLETPDLDDQSAMGTLIQTYGLDLTTPLSAKIRPGDEARLKAAAKALGLSREALEPMQPWLVALTLSILPAARAGYDPNSGVDRLLAVQARAAGKPVAGFETLEGQVRLLADQPPAAQAEFLSSTLDDVDGAVGQIDAMVAAWIAGDQTKLSEEFVDRMRQDYPGVYERLLAGRNRAWAKSVKARLDGAGVAFIAVGAAHLVGPDSLQAQLAKLGVKAERVH